MLLVLSLWNSGSYWAKYLGDKKLILELVNDYGPPVSKLCYFLSLEVSLGHMGGYLLEIPSESGGSERGKSSPDQFGITK